MSAELDSVLRRLERFSSFEKTADARHISQLSSIRRLLADLAHPENNFKVVHVAGTHGKGLTAAMIAAILIGDGRRTGLYSSPYVLDVREEIQVDGQWISESELARLAAVVLDQAESYAASLSRFDLMTAIAFLAFSEAGVEWAVVETGLGGRLDSTNVTDKALAVITPIDFDHTALLGESLSEIAEHKLGILRAGTPVVVAPQDADLTRTLRQRFDDEDRRAIWSNELEVDATFEIHDLPPGWPARTHLDCLRTALVSATSLACEPVSRERRSGWVTSALTVSLPGRLSCYRDVNWKGGARPFATVILDGCHSPAALRACVAQLDQWRIAEYTLILGLARDKLTDRLRGPLAELCRGAKQVILTSFDSPRAALPRESATFLGATGLRLRRADCAAEALLKASLNSERALVVAGSLYLLRDVFRLFEFEGLDRCWP